MGVYDKMNYEIAEHYGYSSQANMLMEECAELIQAINKHKRDFRYMSNETNQKRVDHIAEEIADVEIMIQQVEHLLGIDKKKVEEAKIHKITRQKVRMEGGLNG